MLILRDSLPRMNQGGPKSFATIEMCAVNLPEDNQSIYLETEHIAAARRELFCLYSFP